MFSLPFAKISSIVYKWLLKWVNIDLSGYTLFINSIASFVVVCFFLYASNSDPVRNEASWISNEQFWA